MLTSRLRRPVTAALAVCSLAAAPTACAQTRTFAPLVERLSEPGGAFASDNLVSNETSYLHVLGEFRARGIKGGAYLGVGPEQGFSYIAEIEPEIAIIVDIRRDNLLLHLLFKAMFETARNRMEYLGLLYGRAAPPDLEFWTDADLFDILARLDLTPVDRVTHDRQHRDLMARVARYGVPLSEEDRATVRRFHDEFAYSGLDIRYTSRSRTIRMRFPTARDLYLETDLDGGRASYLATEDRWRRVQALQRQDRVVPVVGDLAGPTALSAIGAYLREAGHTVSVFYLSNVESYLFRYGTFPAFVENVRALPTDHRSVLVRSWFGRGATLPSTVPGHFGTQLVQRVSRFLELSADPELVSYWTLVSDEESQLPVAVPPH